MDEPTWDAILSHNRALVRTRTARPLPPPATMRLAVVACYDPRLDDLLLPALGLGYGDAFLLRTAGALVQPGSGALRSLAMAVYMFGVTEIAIVGHTSCRMAAFDAASFIDTFRRRGVERDAFGSEDLRAWAGAIPSPRRGVELSAENIREAAFLPSDVRVVGAVLDDTTGALDPVPLPQTAPWSSAAAPDAAPAAPPIFEPGGEMLSPGATPPPPAKGADRHASAAALAEAVDRFAGVVRAEGRFWNELPRVRQELERASSPVAKFRVLESFVQHAGTDSAGIRDAFERLRHEAFGQERSLDPDALRKGMALLVSKL